MSFPTVLRELHRRPLLISWSELPGPFLWIRVWSSKKVVPQNWPFPFLYHRSGDHRCWVPNGRCTLIFYQTLTIPKAIIFSVGAKLKTIFYCTNNCYCLSSLKQYIQGLKQTCNCCRKYISCRCTSLAIICFIFSAFEDCCLM